MASSAVEDDLDYNPFYRTLQEKFMGIYHDAQSKCYIICVPHSSALDDVILDRDFAEMHILRPSPYFRGQYLTTDREQSKTMVIENGHIQTGEGFPKARRIKILAEEMGYNKAYQSYKILLLESTIWPPPQTRKWQRRGSPFGGHVSIDPFISRTSIEENTAFLKAFPENEQVIVNADRKVKQFCSNYMVLEKYLEDAAARLKDIWTDISQEFINASHHTACAEKRFQDNLSVASESYLLHGVQEKIFPVICAACQQEDRVLCQRQKQLKDVSGEKLGLPKHFCCPQSAAVLEMDRLDGLGTPLEKLVCMKTTLDVISQTVNGYLLDSQTTAGDDIPWLASDDLIPLLVMVIAESRMSHLSAHLYHVEHFHWSTSSTNDLSYSLVTFRAAVQYMLNTDFSPLQAPPPGASSEKRSKESSISTKASSPGGSPQEKMRNMSRFDRQLDRITRMLDTSTEGLLGPSAQKPMARGKDGNFHPHPMMGGPRMVMRPPNSRNKHSHLGEFLTALKDDVWQSSYGKQN